MVTDPIADLINRINNANKRYKEKVDIPASKIKEKIVQILEKEGYISSYKKIEDYKQGILRIFLKYTPDKQRCLVEMKRISKPGVRRYRKYNEIPRIYNGLGMIIISTSRGIMTDKEAREQHLGGELLCSVW